MIDTHCHLDMLKSEEDLKESLERVDFLITIGCDKEEIKKAIEITNKYENVYASIGYHPYDVNEITDEDLKDLKELAREEEKVVAIGECGLDYYRDITPKDKQIYFFERQIEIAKELNLPLIVHSREANRDTEAILKNYAPFEASGIIHCFGGDLQMMEKCVDMGFYISFAGNITYPKAESLREVLKKVPLDRLLLETDSPFLAPQKKRGKPNKPSYIFYTRDFVANLLGISPEELEKITDENAKRLLKIPQLVS
ncbi:MAG: TatD family deoxyribonuclease [Hydrogenothermus sp.]|nr:MAG: TatD family deoxyribonuclease [Hydrogenothermus sp.]